MGANSDPKRVRILGLIFMAAGAMVLGFGVGKAIIDRTVWVPFLWPGLAMFASALAMRVSRTNAWRAILIGVAIAAIILAVVTSFREGRRFRSERSQLSKVLGR